MKLTGNEKLETQAAEILNAASPEREQAQTQQQEDTDTAGEGRLLDNDTEEIPDAPEEGPQRPPPMDPEAAYNASGSDDDRDNDIEGEQVETKRINFDRLPPELASAPPGECDLEVQARVARWLELQRDGRRLTDTLRSSRDYRNPEFFKKMVEYWEIDEHGTALPPEVFNPGALPKEDFIEALKKEWTEEDQRKKAARAAGSAKIEFTQAGGARGGSATATATATAAAIKAAQLMAAKLAASKGGGGTHKR